jgi:O-antigen ligase
MKRGLADALRMRPTTGERAGPAWWPPGWARLAPWLALSSLPLIALSLARSPLLTTGIVLGVVVFLVTLQWPLAVVGLMLAIGPLDLSFVTGGFKGLVIQFGGLDMNGIRLIGIVISVCAVMVVNPDLVRDTFSRHGRWYAIFLLVATATLMYSSVPLDGARLLLKLAYPFLVFLVVAAVPRSEETLRRVVDAMLVGGVLIAAVLLPALIAFGFYELFDGRLVFPAVGRHQNPFSFYMLMLMLLALARFAVRGGVRYLVAAAVFGTWLALTYTRITVGAAVVGLGAMGVFAGLATRNYRALAVAFAASVLLVAPVLPVLMERTFGRVVGGGELLSLLSDPVGLYYLVDWQGRQTLWPLAVQAFGASPIWGHGLGSSSGVIGQLIPGSTMHNEYLRLLIDMGVMGTALFAAALLTWLFGLMKAARSSSALARECALPAAGGLLAWAVISFTDNPFDYYGAFTQYIGMLTAAALAAAGLLGRVTCEADGAARGPGGGARVSGGAARVSDGAQQ